MQEKNHSFRNRKHEENRCYFNDPGLASIAIGPGKKGHGQ